MRTEIGWGSIQGALAGGLEDLIAAHWLEVETDAQPLAVDWPKLMMFERAGFYQPILAHVDGVLVGYAAYFVQPSTHYKRIEALNDVLYVDPDHRGRLGVRLLREAETLLRANGVALIVQGDRNLSRAPGSARLGDLLTRSGYALVERVYAKGL